MHTEYGVADVNILQRLMAAYRSAGIFRKPKAAVGVSISQETIITDTLPTLTPN